jgi:signal transduction histidine kinase
MHKETRNEEIAFARIRKRGGMFLACVLGALILQIATTLFIDSKQESLDQLKAGFFEEKREIDAIGRLIQEAILVSDMGMRDTPLFGNILSRISQRAADVIKAGDRIDWLITQVCSPMADVRSVVQERQSYRKTANTFLWRAATISSDVENPASRALAMTDMIVSPHGQLNRSYETITEKLHQLAVDLRLGGLLLVISISAGTALFAAFFVMMIFRPLIGRARNDYRQLINSMNVRTRYFYQMSHELRTPLNAVIGFSEMALQLDHGGKANEYARMILQAGTRLAGHIDNIILLSQLQSGEYEPSPVRFDIVKEVEKLRRVLPFGKVQFIIEKPDGDAQDMPVEADRDAIRRILHQLVSNAVNHARSEVRARLSSDTTWIRIQIRDDGPGVPDELLERLFEPFQTAKNSYETSDSGPGIGLTVARLLADVSNARLDVIESSPSGLVIELRIPTPSLSGEHSLDKAAS